jgi:hypothetical protein
VVADPDVGEAEGFGVARGALDRVGPRGAAVLREVDADVQSATAYVGTLRDDVEDG